MATELAAERRIPLPASTVTRQLQHVAPARVTALRDLTTGLIRTIRTLGSG
jgi:hypothetical protein